MNLNILSLNCQKNHNENLLPFLRRILQKGRYDIFLLQEATNEVLEPFNSLPEYTVVNTKDEHGRLALPCVVYNSKKCKLKNFFYKPILLDNFERQELKRPFQSFGIARAVLDFQGIKITAGSIHLSSGFSSKRRINDLISVKKIMDDVKDSDISFYGGDCNFCFASEVRRASNIVNPDYTCVTSNLGPTLDSYYTESHLRYSWVYMNNILRKLGIRIKLKTDHLFVDSKTVSKNNLEIKILPDRVSDHSPIEMILRL